ncbi:MAG: hypothetical protein KF744_07995 [Taibaiella sp.]|nr:hypothetical protein [Taibaiella sp.]
MEVAPEFAQMGDKALLLNIAGKQDAIMMMLAKIIAAGSECSEEEVLTVYQEIASKASSTYQDVLTKGRLQG